MKALGYTGYEALFQKSETGMAPEFKIPIVTISIAFAVFMVLILGLYLWMLKKEQQAEKKQQVLGYEDKNSYS